MNQTTSQPADQPTREQAASGTVALALPGVIATEAMEKGVSLFDLAYSIGLRGDDTLAMMAPEALTVPVLAAFAEALGTTPTALVEAAEAQVQHIIDSRAAGEGQPAEADNAAPLPAVNEDHRGPANEGVHRFVAVDDLQSLVAQFRATARRSRAVGVDAEVEGFPDVARSFEAQAKTYLDCADALQHLIDTRAWPPLKHGSRGV